jgi:hypothetical protein
VPSTRGARYARRYATIELADVLELRAADLQQRAMLEDYMGELPLPAGARIPKVG